MTPDRKLEWNGRQWHPFEFMVCMAFDAFRVALGIKPAHFSVREIAAWLEARNRIGLQ